VDESSDIKGQCSSAVELIKLLHVFDGASLKGLHGLASPVGTFIVEAIPVDWGLLRRILYLGWHRVRRTYRIGGRQRVIRSIFVAYPETDNGAFYAIGTPGAAYAASHLLIMPTESRARRAARAALRHLLGCEPRVSEIVLLLAP
jgi:hypothetical protein